MDENKRAKLIEIGYVVRDTCRRCFFSSFSLQQYWGTCTIQVYERQKHSEATRQLSICKDGWCKKFMASDAMNQLLGKFAEFLEK
jgi:hypothetical protein